MRLLVRQQRKIQQRRPEKKIERGIEEMWGDRERVDSDGIDQLTRTHSPRSNAQQAPDGKTILRSADPSRGRVHTASRDGPSSDSVAVGTRTARRRSVRSARTLGSNVPTCLYSACSAT